MRTDRRCRWLLSGLAVCVLAGCGDGATTSTTGEAGPERDVAVTVAPARPDLAAFVQALSLGGDLDSSPTPADHAAAAELIVRGTVQGVREGRELVLFEGSSLVSAVLEVAPTELLKGALPEGSDGTIYVEQLVRPPARQELPDTTVVLPGAIEDLRATLPVGAHVLVYVTRSTLADGDDRMVDPAAGRPEGQVLWQPRLGSGFVLWNEQGLFVPEVPWWSGVGLTVEDFLPDRTENPPYSEVTTSGG